MLDDQGFKDYFFRIAPLWVLEMTYNDYLMLRKGKSLITDQEILDFKEAIKGGWYK